MTGGNLKASLKAGAIAVSAEVVGTAILMFLGCMGCTTGFKPTPTPSIQGPLVFGMAVASIIQIFGHVSGAHLNPAVTAAAWVYGLTSLPLSLAYIVAQVAGATAGYGLLVAITPDHILDMARDSSQAFCGTAPSEGLTEVQSFFAEFLVTSLLILMCCASWDKRNEAKQDSVAIKFGILVAAISLAEGPYTGGSMNPARSFAPSVFYNAWDSHWIYWVAPLSAGFLIAFAYKFIYTEKTNPEVSGNNTIEIRNGSTNNDKPMIRVDSDNQKD